MYMYSKLRHLLDFFGAVWESMHWALWGLWGLIVYSEAPSIEPIKENGFCEEKKKKRFIGERLHKAAGRALWLVLPEQV